MSSNREASAGPFRLLAVDMDHTLLNSEWRITPRSRQAVREVQARGVTVTLATGRMFRSARPYALELGLGDIPLITYNGGLVVTAVSGRVLLHRPVPLHVAREIIGYAEENGYQIQLYVDDRFIVKEINPKAMYYSKLAGVEAVPVGNLLEFLRQEPTKMLIYEDEALIRSKIWPELKARFGDRVSITSSYPYFLEIMNPEVSKGKALRELAAHLGVRRQEVMAIGDSFNDLDMLEFAGLGVAMGNAPAEVRATADYVTGSYDEDGVAAALDRFILTGGGSSSR